MRGAAATFHRPKTFLATIPATIPAAIPAAMSATSASAKTSATSSTSSAFKVGLFGIGLDTYWPQFEGLHERLLGYQTEVAERLTAETHAAVVDLGIVDTPQRARETAAQLNAAAVDLIILYITTYALSHTVLPVVQGVRAPIVVLNAQPVARIDYAYINALGDRGRATGEWLAHCQACSAPEIASVMRRARLPFRLVTGYLQEDYLWRELGEYVRAAQVVKGLRESRIGLAGHYYNGMLDVYSDLTRLAGVFGCHFELVEFRSLVGFRQNLGGGPRVPQTPIRPSKPNAPNSPPPSPSTRPARKPNSTAPPAPPWRSTSSSKRTTSTRWLTTTKATVTPRRSTW